MYPGLTHGAISALHIHGSDELKKTYLEKLISGEWTGTMCLTEPQCGTDLGLIRTRANPNDDGSYAIEGTKIWITGGEHDLVDNIVYLVLTKLPRAPDTTKGISLFAVPKFLPDSGERNPAFCGGLEHKMGIKGSATCVMNFEGAKGWLVGEPNDGMRAMALFAGHQLNLSVAHPDAAVRESADDLVQLLTPMVKSFLTDEGFNNTNTGLQVLGGSGFTTDWPLEQLVRTFSGTLSGYLKDNPEAPHREALKDAMKALETATLWLATNAPKDPEQAGAAATPYLRLMALTVIGYLWSRMANVANQQLESGQGNKPLLESKVVCARFYFEKLLPEVHWLLSDVQSGKDSLMAFTDDHWAA